MRVVSFDVFDTVLVRVQARPVDLFGDLGAELAAAGLKVPAPAEFARVRQQAELTARRSAPGGEVTLSEIYAELASHLGWDAAERARAQERELELESESLKPVPGMGQRVLAARAEADEVWFLSDMYLPAAFIESLLRREGFFRHGDRLFVSGEHRASKHRGDLFTKARVQAGRLITDWLHVGDNPHADDAVPRAQAIRTELRREAGLNRYEALACGTRPESTWCSVLAGAMRRARLANPETDPTRRIIWDTGCDIVGPLVVGFVHWCLEQSAQRGLRRLYFVARDGQLPQRVAERLASAWNYPVECRYLHGSRQAWHPASVWRLQEADRAWVLRRTRGLNLLQVLERLGLQAERLTDQLLAAGFAQTGWRAALEPAETEALWRWLQSPPMAAVIAAEAARRRALVKRYLAQEGVGDGTPWGMVDIGWHGHLQRSLGRVLADEEGELPLAGFYLGLLPSAASGAGHTMDGYWNLLPAHGHGVARLNHALLELFLAADHGSVLGFREEAGRIVSVLREASNPGAPAWSVATLQAAVLKFTECWLEVAPRAVCPPPDWLAVAREMYLEFYERPTREEAAVWGAVPFADGQVEQELHTLTPQLVGPLWRAIPPGRRPVYWWMEGALAQQSCWPLRLYLALRKAKRRLTE